MQNLARHYIKRRTGKKCDQRTKKRLNCTRGKDRIVTDGNQTHIQHLQCWELLYYGAGMRTTTFAHNYTRLISLMIHDRTHTHGHNNASGCTHVYVSASALRRRADCGANTLRRWQTERSLTCNQRALAHLFEPSQTAGARLPPDHYTQRDNKVARLQLFPDAFS